jgi:hypothetical protein
VFKGFMQKIEKKKIGRRKIEMNKKENFIIIEKY